MERINRAADISDETAEDKHVVKMWTPYNIKVDENYKFIPENKAFIKFSNGLKSFAIPVLNTFDKMTFRFKVEGKENLAGLENKGYVSVCNHVNFLDCSMIAVALNRKDIVFTAIKENFEIPVVRLFVKSLGAIPIPRSIKAMQKFSEAVDTLLQSGKVVHFYPEGVLFPYYNGIREFHRGAFNYAVKNNVPVVPALITYHKPETKLKKKPTATIHILPPVYPDSELSEREQISLMQETVRKNMQDKFDSTDCLRDNTAVLAKYQQ